MCIRDRAGCVRMFKYTGGKMYNQLKDEVRTLVDEIFPEIISIRRDFHRHPELSEHEERTARMICRYLSQWGIEYRDNIGGHGIVGRIDGKLHAPAGRRYEDVYKRQVEIKGIAREAGSRTKMAVYTEYEDIDPVGACVGTRGTRVQAIVDELHGEKIDIITWSENPAELIANVLSPAKVEKVIIDEENEKTATVVVPDYQLSLAIGKEGQNCLLYTSRCV